MQFCISAYQFITDNLYDGKISKESITITEDIRSHSPFLKHSQINIRRSISLLCTLGNTADKLDT